MLPSSSSPYTTSNLLPQQRSTNRCWERVKAGFVSGAILGLSIGSVYGIVGMVSSPAGASGLGMAKRIQILAKTMTASAASFGFFLAVGSAIRCEPLGGLAERRDSRHLLVGQEYHDILGDTNALNE